MALVLSMTRFISRYSPPVIRIASGTGMRAPWLVRARPRRCSYCSAVMVMHDGGGHPGHGGQRAGADVQFQRFEQRVVAALPGGAGVFHPVDLGLGAGQGVEVQQQQFGGLGGQLPGQLAGAVDALLHGEVAVLLAVLDFLQAPVGVVVGQDPFGQLGQVERVELGAVADQLGFDLARRVRPGPPQAACPPSARRGGLGVRKSPRPPARPPPPGRSAASGCPVRVRRGPAASAARTRPAASAGSRRSNPRSSAPPSGPAPSRAARGPEPPTPARAPRDGIRRRNRSKSRHKPSSASSLSPVSSSPASRSSAACAL